MNRPTSAHRLPAGRHTISTSPASSLASTTEWCAFADCKLCFFADVGQYKTLSEGINKMSKEDVQAAWDDDVLTGEIMWSLPSAPHCRPPPSHSHREGDSLPDYCDPQWTAPWGWQPGPPNPDPRTDLNRLDFLRHAVDPDWVGSWFGRAGDLATHSWWFKFESNYRQEWTKRVKGKVWSPPNWIKKYADPAYKSDFQL